MTDEQRLDIKSLLFSLPLAAIQQRIDAAITKAVAARTEECAKACDGIYLKYGHEAHVAYTHEMREILKHRAGGAGECAVAIRNLEKL